MALKSENPIYTMIKALLAKADKPLTCVDLIDDHELKTEAHRQVERSSNQRYRLDSIEQINRAVMAKR